MENFVKLYLNRKFKNDWKLFDFLQVTVLSTEGKPKF